MEHFHTARNRVNAHACRHRTLFVSERLPGIDSCGSGVDGSAIVQLEAGHPKDAVVVEEESIEARYAAKIEWLRVP